MNASVSIILAALCLVGFFTIIRLRKRNNELDNLLTALIQAHAIEQFNKSARSSNSIKDITIVIATLNERDNLEQILPRMPKSVYGHDVGVLLIDDGSTDGTSELPLNSLTALVSIPLSQGQGAALRLGYLLALSHGAKIVVTMDADGQNLPEEIETLVEPIISKNADFVIGSRIIGRFEKDDPVRLLGVLVFSRVLNVLAKIKITDCSNGFRAMKSTVLEAIVENLSQRQYHSAELIMEAAGKGFKIVEVPATFLKRVSGHSKKGNNFFYGLAFTRTILMTHFRSSNSGCKNTFF